MSICLHCLAVAMVVAVTVVPSAAADDGESKQRPHF